MREYPAATADFLTHKALSGLAAIALAGCATTHATNPAAPPCPGICSDGSGYAPVARLFVSTHREGDTLNVRVDSGVAGVPELRPATPGPALMARLALRAFVAVAADPDSSKLAMPDVTALPARHSWILLASSASRIFADTLHYGEVRTIPPATFRIAFPPGGVRSDAWLGFAITGDAIDPRAESPSRGTMRGGVQVYICDPRNLAGVLDDARARRLGERYTATC